MYQVYTKPESTKSVSLDVGNEEETTAKVVSENWSCIECEELGLWT